MAAQKCHRGPHSISSTANIGVDAFDLVDGIKASAQRSATTMSGSEPSQRAILSSTQQEPLRWMVVTIPSSSAGMISRWLGSEPDMVVAASLRTGLDAVNQIERVNPDVAVLDIEMPDLDGISALPLLLAKKRNLIIIMASTLTRRNAEISFKALSLGASDYIPKAGKHPRARRG